MTKKKVKFSLFVTLIVCCMIITTMLMLPSKIGDIIYLNSTNCEITAVQVLKSSTADAPIYTYYTTSKLEIQSFIDLIGEENISLSEFSINADDIIEYATTLYQITIYKADTSPIKLAITPEGELYTQYAVFNIENPENTPYIMSLATQWE